MPKVGTGTEREAGCNGRREKEVSECLTGSDDMDLVLCALYKLDIWTIGIDMKRWFVWDL